MLNTPQSAVTVVGRTLVDLLFAHGLALELAQRDEVGTVATRVARWCCVMR